MENGAWARERTICALVATMYDIVHRCSELPRPLRLRRRMVKRSKVLPSIALAPALPYQENRHDNALPTMNWLRDPPGPVTSGELPAMSPR
jgi:hypothetical protein